MTKAKKQRRIKIFIEMTGREPEQDDLDRTFCLEAGQDGHYYCGICEKCKKPRFICTHPHPRPSR